MQDPLRIPKNERLLDALEDKKEDEKARNVMSKYDILSPEVTERLPNIEETMKREYPPKELKLKEVTREGEMIYLE